MKKQTNHHYDDMMQVYHKMHEDVSQLAKQVLELDNLKHKLGYQVKYIVQNMLTGLYGTVAGLDWMLKLNNDKKFLEFCFMWLYGYVEDEDSYEARIEYLDKREELNAPFHYIIKLRYNHILPL